MNKLLNMMCSYLGDFLYLCLRVGMRNFEHFLVMVGIVKLA
jgi:hypothetical protein